MPTCGVGLSVRGRGGEGYPFGICLDGPRAARRTGPIQIPGVHFVFFFFFFCLLFLS
jgi:hypothetical protein